MSDPPKRRPGTAAEHHRDVRQTTAAPAGLIARASGGERSGVPLYAQEEVTGRYEGAELERIRGMREPEDRMGRMEKKHDALAAAVTEIAVSQGTMGGKLDTLVELAAASAVEREKRAAQDAADRAAAAAVEREKRAAQEIADAAAAAVRERMEKLALEKLERKRKYIIGLISAIGVILVGLAAAAIK